MAKILQLRYCPKENLIGISSGWCLERKDSGKVSFPKKRTVQRIFANDFDGPPGIAVFVEKRTKTYLILTISLSFHIRKRRREIGLEKLGAYMKRRGLL